MQKTTTPLKRGAATRAGRSAIAAWVQRVRNARPRSLGGAHAAQQVY
jgi:hypothetical protein